MYKNIITIFLFSFFFINPVFAVTYISLKNNLIISQNNNFNNLKKYKHVPLVYIDDYSYSVTEYETPDNTFGYQIIFNFSDRIESYATGDESDVRTFVQYIYSPVSSSTPVL